MSTTENVTDGRHTHVVNVPAGMRARVTIEEAAARRPGPGWFRMFRPIVRRMIWARMSPAAHAVYPILAERADQDWVTRIPYQQPAELVGTDRNLGLVELSGYSPASVARAMRELRRDGLLIVRVDGRGRDCGVYQLVPPVETQNQADEAGKHITGDRLNQSPVTGSRATGDRFNQSPVRDSQYIERTREILRPSLETTTAESAAAAVLLRVKGLTADDARDLARMAGGSVEKVRRASEYALDLVQRGKLKGTIYGAIQFAINNAIAVRADAHRGRVDNRADHRAAARRRELAEFAEEETRDAALKTRLAAMTPADRDELVAAALAELTPAALRRLKSRDALHNRVVRAAVAVYLEKRAEVTA